MEDINNGTSIDPIDKYVTVDISEVTIESLNERERESVVLHGVYIPDDLFNDYDGDELSDIEDIIYFDVYSKRPDTDFFESIPQIDMAMKKYMRSRTLENILLN
jgi:hypothetical protein